MSDSVPRNNIDGPQEIILKTKLYSLLFAILISFQAFT